ncbi:MAG: chromate transporter, partial [Akkermansiaceae bacterium]|nr:chromate transporter [Akkermansiaceae bacterium]
SRGDFRFQSALTAMTAAVVGVILNLAVWFAWHVVVPETGRPDYLPLGLAALFLFLMVKRGWSVMAIVGIGAGIGGLLHFGGFH